MTTEPTLAQLGEDAVLARILPLLPSGEHTLIGPGDDSAVLRVPGERLVVTTDTMAQGPDFRLAWSQPEDLGVKAVASNLADIAAMGAEPIGLLVAITAPAATPVAVLEGFARGLARGVALMAPGVGVVGGDLGTADHLMIAVTAFGVLPEGRAAIRRDGARPGDVLALAGRLGLAAAGLELLFREAVGLPDETGPGEPDARLARRLRSALPRLIEAQLAPEAPVAAGAVAALAGASAMMDVSDGLRKDAGRLARASGVDLLLEPEGLAVFAEELAAAYAPDREAPSSTELRRLLLLGAEDHGLLATFPEDVALPAPFRRIGRVVPSGAGAGPESAADPSALARVRIEGPDGSSEDVDASGWDPYRGWDGRRG